jgi:hypothetical protein
VVQKKTFLASRLKNVWYGSGMEHGVGDTAEEGKAHPCRCQLGEHSVRFVPLHLLTQPLPQMFDLKAMVYQKEQEMKNGDPNSTRRRRGKREAAPNRRDLFAKKNKGIDSRNKYDKEERKSKSAASQSALAAKAALYEQIGNYCNS